MSGRMRREGYSLEPDKRYPPSQVHAPEIDCSIDKVEVVGNGLSSSFKIHIIYLGPSQAMRLIDSKVFRCGDSSWKIQPRSYGADLSRVGISHNILSESQTYYGDLWVAFRSLDGRSIIEVKVHLPDEDDCVFVGTSDGFSDLEVIVGSRYHQRF